MTLEISLRNPFGLPLALQARKDEPERGYHWINQRHSSDRGASTPNDRDGKPRGGKTRQKVRPLTDLTLGEVEDAYTRFENQLLPTHGNWIAKNYFCQIPLKRRREVPPLVFGRVKTCFPSDGVVDNVEELELYFPQKSGPPDVLHIQKDEISQGSQKWVQSF